MKRRVARCVVALVVGALSLAGPAVVRPAAAAMPLTLIPIETLLPLLAPLTPAFEVVSPIVWPQCGNALLVSVLPGALGADIPPEVYAVIAPLLVICGSVPQPSTNTRKCQIDQQAMALLAKLTTAAAGTALPVEIAPAKWLSGQVTYIEDAVKLPAIPLGSTVAGVLTCVDPSTPTTTTTLAGAPTTAPPAEVADSAFDYPVDPPSFEELQTLPPVAPNLAIKPIGTAPQVRFINQPRFRYPVVMGLPLLFIGLLLFFGRALSRPLSVEGDHQ